MDKTLKDYDKNLEDLEIQRTKLEKVMKMMGQEWEESGAGIGWLGSLDLAPIIQETTQDTTVKALQTTITVNSNNNNADDKSISLPFLSNILSENTGPSPAYLQSLLNVNDTLLAQSLANHSDTTPMLTHLEDQFSEMMITTTGCLSSPLLTPTTTNGDSDYMENVNPHSEMVISPLESIKLTTCNDAIIANTTTI
ncbi:hypothetical protein MFLAVUS_011207 [Mucor flavus]|uniref:Uncharacterized protein n=1 Tax=Mucor flavus TaxID=439312 RepID=A0ABP9ZEY4_9FUNG